MIDTDKYEEFLAKHAPSTKKQIYVADTSSGRVQDELWRIAISSLIEVKRLRSITDDLYAYIVSDADISLSIIEEQMDWREEE